MRPRTQLRCVCGQARVEVQGAPITATECHCNSCRAAGARMGTLLPAKSVQEPNGGTRFVLYRKDRVRFLEGVEQLKHFRLKPESPTRRVKTSCTRRCAAQNG